MHNIYLKEIDIIPFKSTIWENDFFLIDMLKLIKQYMSIQMHSKNDQNQKVNVLQIHVHLVIMN